MVLRRAATEMPRAAEVKVLLGTVHLLAHNTAVAETYLRQALEDDPECTAARFELANLLVAKGEKSEARLMFAACIEAEKSRLPRLGKAQQDSFTERAMRALVELQDTCKDSA